MPGLAQDTIYFRNKSIAVGVVKEINPQEVKYNLFSNPSWPLYTVLKNETEKINYKEGLTDTFTLAPQYISANENNQPTPEKPFNKKNVILFNPLELADGAIGFSYMRILYKQRINFFAATSIPNGNSAILSSGSLLEKNENYYLSKKRIDFSLGANFNLSKDRKFFPFIGPLLRVAKFDGAAYSQPFVLNKYYIYGNIGFISRSTKGFSFMMKLALGHYYNDYQSNNPRAIMDKNYVIQPRNKGISSFIFSMQFGYSF